MPRADVTALEAVHDDDATEFRRCTAKKLYLRVNVPGTREEGLAVPFGAAQVTKLAVHFLRRLC